jgi:hypothetical protein
MLCKSPISTAPTLGSLPPSMVAVGFPCKVILSKLSGNEHQPSQAVFGALFKVIN